MNVHVATHTRVQRTSQLASSLHESLSVAMTRIDQSYVTARLECALPRPPECLRSTASVMSFQQQMLERLEHASPITSDPSGMRQLCNSDHPMANDYNQI